jgi:hypothetical protein
MAQPVVTRGSIGDRTFPLVASNPYAEPPLGDLSRRPLGRLQEVGFRLGPLDSIVRLLALHRRAIEEETRGRLERADFWWQEARQQWKAVPASHAGWAEVIAVLAPGRVVDPAAMRAAIGRELLVDVHIAFGNGAALGQDQDRARWHYAQALEIAEDGELGVDAAALKRQVELQVAAVERENSSFGDAIRRIERLLAHAPDDAEVARTFADLHLAAADRARLQRKYDVAAEHVHLLATRFPHEPHWAVLGRRLTDEGLAHYRALGKSDKELKLAQIAADSPEVLPRHLDRIVRLLVDEATEGIDSSDDFAKSKSRAGHVRERVEALQRLLERHPACHPAYEALALLHRIEAVHRANAGEWPEALVALEATLAVHPDDEQAKKDRRQIESMLKKAAKELERTQNELRGSVTRDRDSPLAALVAQDPSILETILQANLTDTGRRARAAVKAGTAPRDRFRDSPDCTTLRRAAQGSVSAWLWWRLLGRAPAPDDVAAAETLRHTLEGALAKKPMGAELLALWPAIVETVGRPKLDGVSPEPLLEVLSGEDLKPRDDDEEVALEPPPGSEAPTPPAVAAVPFLRRETRVQVRGPEYVPFTYWVFSDRGLAAKIMFAAGLVLLLWAGGVAVTDGAARSRRNVAYAQLGEALVRKDVATARSAAGAFIDDAGTFADPRRAHVEQRLRDLEFELLQAAVDRGASREALLAAESFLGARGSADDQRREVVTEQYYRAFLDWVRADGAASDPDTKERIVRHRDLGLGKVLPARAEGR